MKVKYYELIKMLANKEIKCGTMIRLLNTNDGSMSNWFIFTGNDRRFHRCDRNGNMSAKLNGTLRFINYDYFDKEFEIIEVLEEPTLPKKLGENDWELCKQKDKVNEIIDYLDYLSSKERK